MRVVIVELANGEQQFFNRLADGFRFAKEQENKHRHSVDYVGSFDDDENTMVFTGQSLRWLLRSVDNLPMWIKAVCQS